MVTETRARLAFHRQVNELGVGMSIAEAMPPRSRARLFKLTWWLRFRRPTQDATGRDLGVWLSHTFDYDEPPTLAEMLDAHPLYHTAEEMWPDLLLAQFGGYIVWRDSDEGTVFLPGPKLR